MSTILKNTGHLQPQVVAWEVHDAESGLLAKQLIERALLREGCWSKPPVLHSDNGAPMTSYTLRARLAELGMPMSHSRPRVSNDNPYSESLFRTLKYCPAWPSKGFASLADVRDWMLAFKMRTTPSTCIVASTSSRQMHAMLAKTWNNCSIASGCMRQPNVGTLGAGPGQPVTGSRLVLCHSTPVNCRKSS